MEIKHLTCPVEVALHIIGEKWKLLILWHLKNNIRQFDKLRKLMPSITEKNLTQQLRELECDGLIYQKVYMQVPAKVEYALTEYGKALKQVLNAIHQWGTAYLNREENMLV